MALVTVIGANGVQGLAQLRQARAEGYEVRAISRTRSAALKIEFPDIEFRAADLLAPETIRTALEGSDYVLANHPVPLRTRRLEMLIPVAEACRDLDVKRLVYNSASWIPDRAGDPFSYGDNTALANALFRTGASVTMFGSVLFMDNLQTAWAKRYIVDEDRFHYPHGESIRANWISLDDSAKCMVHAMTRSDFEGSWMNLGGPERLSPREVCAILSEVTGREIRYDPTTPEEFGRMLSGGLGNQVPLERKQAMADYMRDFYVYNNTAPTTPFAVDFGHVQRRIPIEFETLRQWAMRQNWSAGSMGTGATPDLIEMAS